MYVTWKKAYIHARKERITALSPRDPVCAGRAAAPQEVSISGLREDGPGRGGTT